MALSITVLLSVLSSLVTSSHCMFLDGGLPLPQYSKYGRSLVLVGGALQDNNTEIYNTIIDMAVSMILVCL